MASPSPSSPSSPSPTASPPGPRIETDRLVLRRWTREDRKPFAAMNSDPQVMEFFPSMLDEEQSDALAAKADSLFDKHGFGLWAVEVKGGDSFIGFVGLAPFSEDEAEPLPFAPGVEVGWRLAHHTWGQGYAPEAAKAAMRFGFTTAGLNEIVSFTSTINLRSRRVMEKIGLRHDDADDFDHPRVPQDHRLRPHVLYRLTAAEYRTIESGNTGDT